MGHSAIFDAIGKTATVSGVQDAINGKSIFAALELQGVNNSALALVLQNYTKVGWTSLNHTSDHVLVSAFGPGSEHG